VKGRNMFTPIDEEERELIDSIENEEWKEIDDIEEYKIQAKRFAEATIKKDKRMNIRISERDLKNLKIKAMEEGLPYQTLVTMILHKYISGRLVEKV
jgi:predicted DNA binding CopG/RHH family protein